MKILFVHSGADLYGAGRSLLRLSARLVRDSHGVRVVLPWEGPLRAELEKAGAQVRVLTRLPILRRDRFRNPARFLALWFRAATAVVALLRLIREDRPNIVHTNTATVFLASAIAARWAGIPHVWHAREFFSEFGWAWPLYRWMILRLSDRVVCVSSAVARQFGDPADDDRLAVIHNGLPIEEFGPVHAERIAAFRRAVAPGPGRLVGVVGRVKLARKGQETLVRAAQLLDARYPDARFLIVGSPFPGNDKHLDRLKEIIRQTLQEDRVLCVGEAQDIKAALAALDILVLSSGLPEPFGGVVLEAMALGKPVVGTRIGGTPEQIEDGVTGFLVPPGDAAAMAEALARLLGDPALSSRMGQAGRRKLEREFLFDGFYKKMFGVYDELVEDRPMG
ncbi:MAG: glycosyltransferase [Verrucomicrobiota bacterium]|nr:glycosyltransferase [Verrucomicrobiota bacterium]